jgi:hypothetical protein
MFVDYKIRVLEDYRIKKASNGISLNLIHATPAKIKAECLAVFDTRFLKKDEKLLISLFGERESELAYRNAIKQCEADKFKPLSNFLKASTKNTDERNIELLAWLIDYEPRPYRFNLPKLLADNSHEVPTAPNIGTEHREITTKMVNYRKLAVICSAAMLILMVTFLINHYSQAGVSPTRFPITGQEECMFWTGDHYQPVLCSQKIENATVYALDRDKVARLRMIVTPDTLTKESIGHVWYAKIHGKVEFYTADGYHPIYTKKRLRPLSLYMYTKYILGK